MTVGELRNKVLSKYKTGQVVKIKRKDGKGTKIGAVDAEIIKFYPYHVLCKINNYHECFAYWDFLSLQVQAKKKRAKKKSGHKGITWNKASENWVVTLWINGKSNYVGLSKNLNEAVKIKDNYLRGSK